MNKLVLLHSKFKNKSTDPGASTWSVVLFVVVKSVCFMVNSPFNSIFISGPGVPFFGCW